MNRYVGLQHHVSFELNFWLEAYTYGVCMISPESLIGLVISREYYYSPAFWLIIFAGS